MPICSSPFRLVKLTAAPNQRCQQARLNFVSWDFRNNEEPHIPFTYIHSICRILACICGGKCGRNQLVLICNQRSKQTERSEQTSCGHNNNDCPKGLVIPQVNWKNYLFTSEFLFMHFRFLQMFVFCDSFWSIP